MVNRKVLIVEDQFVEANDLQLMLKRAGFDVCGIARSVPIAQEMIKKERPDFVLLDIFLKGKQTGIDLAKELRKDNIPFIYLSANSNEQVLSEAKTTEPYGFVVKPFREKDLLITLEIAQYRHEHSLESKYRRESELNRQLEQINQNATWNEKLVQIGKILQPEIPFDFLTIGYNDTEKEDSPSTSILRIGFNEYQLIGLQELSVITGISLKEILRLLQAAKKDNSAAFFINENFEKLIREDAFINLLSNRFGLESHLTFSLHQGNKINLTCNFYSRRTDSYNSEHVALLDRLQKTMIRILENKGGDTGDRKQTAKEPEKGNTFSGFEGIIGNSHLLLNVFDQITQVSPFDTAVLILGESGTGKERVADCIHNLSPRKKKPFIKINCASLPATLIESELFGHEKGSFTGAFEKKVGKFEQANGGSIFLDEIGEMPIDLQAKLLRILQEKEIEPIGGRSPIKIDVRIIAATNKNLEKEVGEGRFRLDLYYRLNVFPVQLPPLRERTEDIPALADHFITIYNRKSGKKITGLSDRVLRNMSEYSWPGNIRELENQIERSVLMAKGNIIEDIRFPTLQSNTVFPLHSRDKTIHENERDHIINILKKCNGKIWGSGGAAEILNLPPSTLKSKMKKLGIGKDPL